MFKVLLKCMVFFIVKVYFTRKKLIFYIQVKHTKKINLPVKPTITNVGSMEKIIDLGDIFLNCIYIILSAVKRHKDVLKSETRLLLSELCEKKLTHVVEK